MELQQEALTVVWRIVCLEVVRAGVAVPSTATVTRPRVAAYVLAVAVTVLSQIVSGNPAMTSVGVLVLVAVLLPLVAASTSALIEACSLRMLAVA